MNLARLRPALRIARRDAWRAKGRSLLVIALIGLPIFALGIGDIAYRTWQLDPGEKLTRAIGAAAAGVQWVGGQVEQAPSGFLNHDWTSSGNDPTTSTPAPAQLRDLLSAQLPAGSRIIERRDNLAGTRVRTPSGVEYTNLTGLDYTDPIAAGLVRPVRGHAPKTSGEAAVTTTLAKAMHVDVGGTITLLDTGPTLQVTAVVADPGYRRAETVYVLPSAVGTAQLSPGGVTWLVSTPAPVSWRQVLALNKLGYVVVSRQTYLHPPPSSQIPWHPGGGSTAAALSLVTLVVGMALFEVVLLAGPAFAVSARRQRRQLALMASTGGRPADLRNVVLVGGLVLGLTAGAIGVALAIAAAAAGIPTLGTLVDQVPGHLDIRPAELAALVLVAVITALAAALFPARSAARTDVVAVLAGRRGTVRTRKRTLAAGVALGALGAVVAIGGATTSAHGASVILAGVSLIELGLITCTPGLIGLVGRTGRRLPLAPRIALRDASRNRSAATPAVAAVMASVIGAIAASLVVASSQDQNRREYRPSLPMNAAWADLSGTLTPGDARAAAAGLRASLPTASIVTVRAPSDSCPLTHPRCPTSEIDFAKMQWMMGHRSRFAGGYLPSTIVDDGSDLTALFGVPEPAAAAALRAGKVVVVDKQAIPKSGRLTLQSTRTVPAPPGSAAPTAVKPRSVRVGAVAVSDGYPITQLIVPPSVASRLGVVPTAVGVFARDSRRPTGAEQRRARGKLATIDPSSYLYVETGYHDNRAWMKYALIGIAAVIAVGAAVIATALADVDGRPDLVTLGAVGADPRTRRVLSLSRAAVIAGIGAALGTAAGFVPAFAWVRASRPPVASSGDLISGSAPLHLVVPWTALAAALFGIPLVAALIAGVFSRSRLPSERPTE